MDAAFRTAMLYAAPCAATPCRACVGAGFRQFGIASNGFVYYVKTKCRACAGVRLEVA